VLLILFNTSSQPPSLIAGFADFKGADALFAGWGTDATLWTTAQSLELDNDVNEAYRWVLYPQSIPGERIPHTWTFMEQPTTVLTQNGTYNYTLPSDFGSFVGQYMIWPLGDAYDPPHRTSDTDILMLRQHRSTSGRPQCFALRWLPQSPGLNQRQEVIFWPTPDAAYTFTYVYAILPGKLMATNPYPLGGPRISQLMIEACKAIGEVKKNGARGDQWNLFIASLQSAIQLDKGTNTTPTVGMMRGSGGDGRYLQQKRPTTSYYFGPSAAGLYTLEV
jgi:hypothetical protein